MTNSTEAQTESTPNLIRLYARMKVVGSHRRLNNDEQATLDSAVNELRRRNILD